MFRIKTIFDLTFDHVTLNSRILLPSSVPILVTIKQRLYYILSGQGCSLNEAKGSKDVSEQYLVYIPNK